MSISSVGSSNSYDSVQMAKTFFKKADADNSGGIDKTELKTMLANGAGNTTSTMNIDDIFAEVDTNGDGSIDETENANQMKKMEGKGAPPAGGKPPSGGSPPSGAGQKPAASSGTSSSASNEVYDEKDTNKDGTVSAQEELAYYISHPQDAESQTGVQKTSGYDQAGKQNIGSGVVNSSVNITA
jgi:hypothetical protein